MTTRSRNIQLFVLTTATLLLFAATLGFANKANSEKPANSAPSGNKEYPRIEWPDLMPAKDLEALLNPPDYINDIKEGSMEDQISRSVKDALAKASDDRYQQALVSTRVRKEFDKRKVTIPGFIVPLEFDNDMVITEFFLVPFFGACIHVPPPPPNQMMHVKYAKGLKLESLYDPFFLEGTIQIKSFSTDDMGSSAYSLQVNRIYPYTE